MNASWTDTFDQTSRRGGWHLGSILNMEPYFWFQTLC